MYVWNTEYLSHQLTVFVGWLSTTEQGKVAYTHNNGLLQ